MAVPPRMNLLTLACRDIERMAAFFRALGWPGLSRLHARAQRRKLGRARGDWGGGFTFRDPEQTLWEVAFAEGATIGADGALTWF